MKPINQEFLEIRIRNIISNNSEEEFLDKGLISTICIDNSMSPGDNQYETILLELVKLYNDLREVQ